jgi:LemA protein
MVGLIIFAAIILMVFLWIAGIYNQLVGFRESVRNGWSQIDVQLKRRHDLIPNLVEVAKGYMLHERTTLENVIKARQQAIDASSIKDKQAAENILTGTLRSLFAVAENYPNLKADRQMSQLQEEISSTENKIAFSRQYYNDEVNRLNVAVQSFPNNFIANAFNFQKQTFFELDTPDERKAPQVKF